MKKLLFLIFFPFTLLSQTIDHWETVVFESDYWNYYVGISEPDSNWRTLAYNDSLWENGQGGFGYGDGDDSTIINSTISLYLRNEFSIIDTSEIGMNNNVGPYARLRPGAKTKNNVNIGNFVEIKKSTLGKKSKVNHLTYIGDSEIGKSVNIGAGTITCNYDGVKKNKTKINDNVFIGSNSSLVAPLTIKEGSTVGAGSVITKNVEKKTLALTRSLQTEVKNYKRK